MSSNRIFVAQGICNSSTGAGITTYIKAYSWSTSGLGSLQWYQTDSYGGIQTYDSEAIGEAILYRGKSQYFDNDLYVDRKSVV